MCFSSENLSVKIQLESYLVQVMSEKRKKMQICNNAIYSRAAFSPWDTFFQGK